jgi:hypothetical protein
MAFLVSPGVQVIEKDLTNIIPQVAASIGGFAGVFEWGPALEAVNVSSEADILDIHKYPLTLDQIHGMTGILLQTILLMQIVYSL